METKRKLLAETSHSKYCCYSDISSKKYQRILCYLKTSKLEGRMLEYLFEWLTQLSLCGLSQS